MNQALSHPAMLQMKATHRVVDAHRPRTGWFYRDITYDGLDLSLVFDRDSDGLHLTEIQAQSDGTELNWIPHHIAELIKARAMEEMNKEEE